LATHYGEMVFTPYNLNEYGGRYLLSPGRQNLPTYLAGLTPESESAIIKGLISELNSKLVAGLDPDPNFSRNANRPAMFCALRDGTIEKALFIGGSNADKLASSTSMLGVDAYKIATGGWKVSKPKESAVPAEEDAGVASTRTATWLLHRTGPPTHDLQPEEDCRGLRGSPYLHCVAHLSIRPVAVLLHCRPHVQLFGSGLRQDPPEGPGQDPVSPQI
jgi:hypothetical protein